MGNQLEERATRVTRKALIAYYGIFLIAVLIAVGGYFFAKGASVPVFEAETVTGIKSASYIYMFAAIPFALWFYAKRSEKVKGDDKLFLRLSLIRIGLVGGVFVFNLVFFYLCFDYNFLYAAGIGAIALLFCKVKKSEIKDKLDESDYDLTEQES